jgi:acylpyruvate hydrolase
MKLATFRPREAPAVQFGALLSDGRLLALRAGALVLLAEFGLPERYDASRHLRHSLAFLESGPEAFSLAYQVIQRAEQALREGQALRGEPGQRLVHPVDSVEFLPPVPRTGKVLAAGRNFAEHAAEVGGAVPDEAPSGFLKTPSSLLGHNGAVIYPAFTQALDYEVEVAAVIGRRAKNVSPETALDYVAGYTIFNDLSARDVQRAESRRGNHLLGKNFDTAGPMGPYLVTADEIADPGRLQLELRVNGELRQRGNTAEMIYSLPRLIAHWSQMTLWPGDVVTTGTPSGVAVGHGDDRSYQTQEAGAALDERYGANRYYLRPGDVIEATVEGLGTLRNSIRPA